MFYDTLPPTKGTKLKITTKCVANTLPGPPHAFLHGMCTTTHGVHTITSHCTYRKTKFHADQVMCTRPQIASGQASL